MLCILYFKKNLNASNNKPSEHPEIIHNVYLSEDIILILIVDCGEKNSSSHLIGFSDGGRSIGSTV